MNDETQDTDGVGSARRPERPKEPARAASRLRKEPTVVLAPEPWDRTRARRLDPTKALRLRGQAPPRPTLYVGDTLLLRGLVNGDGALDALREVATSLSLRLVDDSQVRRDTELLARAKLTEEVRAQLRKIWVSVVRFEPDTDEPALPPDAWAVLQGFRARRPDPGEVAGVALEHVVTSSRITPTPFTESHSVTGNPFTESHSTGGNPFTESHSTGALRGYARAGGGGRQPVAWVGAPPTSNLPLDGSVRRPIVAVLDTGVAEHPWLGSDFVDRDPNVLGEPLGLATDPADTTGTSDPLVGDLDAEAGHGTFIAGLIRQCAPDARILAIRLFGGDGVVAEGQLLRSLQLLALRQALAVSGSISDMPVDVVTLSLGYYHEQPGDVAFDALLLGPLSLLGSLGAVVVVSAGNDATARPMYPAAFTPHVGGVVAADHDALPVVAVGAENPNRSVALFSNDGPWVRVLRPGAALVSTYPQTYDASGQPAAELVTAEGEWRSALDPDDFSSGFAVWSGTSFAAPVLAGEIAARLAEVYTAGNDATDAAAAVERGWAALASATAADPDPLVRP